MSEMIEYCVGFLFDESGNHVVLIEKIKPDWQKGKMNGVGGKVEAERDRGRARRAMAREFEEETGLIVREEEWLLFAALHGEGFRIHFYTARKPLEFLEGAKTIEEERVMVCPVSHLCKWPHVPNLDWLVPLALSQADRRTLTTIMEIPK